jgi:hypothetical protein
MKAFAAVSVVATLISSTLAQSQYSIDPNSVSNATRDAWCTSQSGKHDREITFDRQIWRCCLLASCPLICEQTSGSGTTEENNCDPNQLTYACVCSNGLSPNLTEYTQTLPFYICQEWGTQCVSNCGQDSNCADNCRSQHPCGAQSPPKQNTSTLSFTTSSAAATSGGSQATTTGNGVFSGFASGGSSSSTGGNGAAAATSAGGAYSVHAATLNAGRTFGTLAVIGLLFGGFAILL